MNTTRQHGNAKQYIVTGAAGTLGMAITELLLGSGATVIALDINPAPLDALKTQWQDELRIVALDVTSQSDVDEFAASVAAHNDSAPIHGLVNNVGSEGNGAPIASITLDDFTRLQTTNVTTAFLMCRALATIFQTQKFGSIVNIGSISSLVGSSNDVAYTTAKHALIGLTRALAADLGRYNIRTNCICPGPIESPLMAAFESTQSNAPAVRAWYEHNTPLARYGNAGEVANLAMFLLSDAATFINGAVIPVDGGLTATGRI